MYFYIFSSEPSETWTRTSAVTGQCGNQIPPWVHLRKMDSNHRSSAYETDMLTSTPSRSKYTRGRIWTCDAYYFQTRSTVWCLQPLGHSSVNILGPWKRIWTSTISHWFLKPARLPVPPSRDKNYFIFIILFLIYFTIFINKSQVLFSIFFKPW